MNGDANTKYRYHNGILLEEYEGEQKTKPMAEYLASKVVSLGQEKKEIAENDEL